MTKLIKSRIYTVTLALIFLIGQIFTGASTIVGAAESKVQVSVQVQSFDKIITTGTSSNTNAFAALEDVLHKNNISITSTNGQYGKFISEVNGVKAGKFGGYDGWSYAISRNNRYEDITTGIDGATLQNGDKLIFYYGDMGTVTANKVDFSTTEANKELTINLNNTYLDWTTGNTVVDSISGVKVKIDGVEVVVTDNKITIKGGLAEGIHILSISDFKVDAAPKVVYDEIKFTIGKDATPGNNSGNNGSTNGGTGNVDNTTISKEISKEITTATSLLKAKGINEWSAMSLNKLGEKIDTTFLNEIIGDIRVNGVQDISNTDMEKLIMGLTASGYTPYNVEGYNLVSELFNRDISTFLINDAVFGIFTYNYANIKEDYKVTKDKLMNIILESKLSYVVDGKNLVGWTYYGDKIEPDMTGAAVNALSEFYNTNHVVKESIDAAVNSMSILQNESGYSTSQYGLASESTAFVILGLTSIGINPEGEGFAKEKGDLVSALLSFKAKEGGFKHLVEDGILNYTSTEQSLRALIALKEYKASGKYNFYLSDINSKDLPVFVLENSKGSDGAKDVNESNNVLPQTGAFIDTNVLIILGLLFMATGALYLRKGKSLK